MNQAELDWRVAYIDQEIRRLSKEKTTLLKQTEVICWQTYNPPGGCGAVHLIGELEIIYVSWGDEYSGRGSGDHEFICPACGLRNRLLDEHGKGPKRKRIGELGMYFKSSTSRHDQ